MEDIDNEIMDPDAATEDSRSSSCTNASHGSVLMKDQNAEKTAISSDENSDLNDNDISQGLQGVAFVELYILSTSTYLFYGILI